MIKWNVQLFYIINNKNYKRLKLILKNKWKLKSIIKEDNQVLDLLDCMKKVLEIIKINNLNIYLIYITIEMIYWWL